MPLSDAVTSSLAGLTDRASFHRRHLGPDEQSIAQMLATLGFEEIEDLLAAVVPPTIRTTSPLQLPEPAPEEEVLARLRAHAEANDVRRAYIGLGYHGTLTPAVIRRNILEDPGWYTAYTPYQPEISQGRLEALLVFQTMVADLTGMALAGASLLDEATAAAEGIQLCRRVSTARAAGGDAEVVLVDERCHPQTIAVVGARLAAIGLHLVTADLRRDDLFATLRRDDGEVVTPDAVVAALLQSPDTDGVVHDDAALIAALHEHGILVTVATDLLACTLITPPGEQGADVVVGSSQRFGVPMFAGGPHAAFLATHERYARQLPGRLVGVSHDTQDRPAYRLALQTREQHIRREKATSNICTAQVLLAIVAAMYAVHHGPTGLARIAQRVHGLTSLLRDRVRAAGFTVIGDTWFDTVTLLTDGRAQALREACADAGYEVGVDPGEDGSLAPGHPDRIRIALDETTTVNDVAALLTALGASGDPQQDQPTAEQRDGAAAPTAARADLVARADALLTEHDGTPGIAGPLRRTSSYLTDPRFHRYRSETELVRWLRRLKAKDIALDRSMIPLGSCTMKLNAAVEMESIAWPSFADLHPFAPADRMAGTRAIIADLEAWLGEITGYDAVSLQPNSGAQGELAGLLAIRGYHRANGDTHRDVCLVPSSAHGTNAASAVMAGMRVKVVACDRDGNVDLEDLARLAGEHADDLAAMMITYPSTHGVFETAISDICALVHDHGGQVYLDGANLNALVGLAQPGRFGADVSHLNLHKTFCIPHGGGGPGVGPVACRSHLAPFLPAHPMQPASWPHAVHDQPGSARTGPVAGAPWGSAGILQISWAYVALMGASGLQRATETAIVSANYVARRLAGVFDVLYTGAQGLVAHEAIIDIRASRAPTITNEDVAKRLIDHGFHAPTMSFPVAGTLMIEPTESESKRELDRFCAAIMAIRTEIDQIADGHWPADDNPLVHAPHTAADLLATQWQRPYTREEAAYPPTVEQDDKYWPPVSRINNAHGDRNLMCTCPPPEALQEP